MPRVNPGPPCTVCGIPSEARNLCAKHLKRWQRHGHVDETRPPDWGEREKHELNGQWKWTVRVREGRDERWNDFWAFVKDVGPRPSPKHVLRRYRRDQPFGPENFYWMETQAAPDWAARMRRYRQQNPTVFKKIYLKKKGLTLEDYDRMMEAQDCKCAICGEAETAKHTYGYTFSLAVDHCHTTGKIRGLLCGRCNRGLGYFRDSAEILAKAIAYLRLTTAVPSPP